MLASAIVIVPPLTHCQRCARGCAAPEVRWRELKCCPAKTVDVGDAENVMRVSGGCGDFLEAARGKATHVLGLVWKARGDVWMLLLGGSRSGGGISQRR